VKKNHPANLESIPVVYHGKISSNFIVKILIFVAFFIQPAVARVVNHGTFFVAGVSPEYVVVAIDSREMKGTVPYDQSCKIVPFSSNAFFFYAGVISTNQTEGTDFDGTNIAKNSYKKFGAETTKIAEIADDWARGMIGVFEQRPLAYGAGAVHGIMTNGYFVGTGPDGNLLVEGRFVIYDPRFHAFASFPVGKPPTFVDPMLGATYANGHANLIKEFSNGAQTDRASKVLAQIGNYPTNQDTVAARYKAYVGAVEDWTGAPDIGGETAVIILERGEHWRWFNRPSHCPKIEKEN